MGLYTKLYDEKKNREKLKGKGEVLFISCPGCACECLSYSKGYPCRLLEKGKNMEESAVAVGIERDYWTKIMEEEGMNVEHACFAFPCEFYDEDIKAIQEKAKGKDKVVILACSSGFLGVKNILGDFQGKIISLMYTAGTFVFRLKRTEDGLYSTVDQEEAIVIENKRR